MKTMVERWHAASLLRAVVALCAAVCLTIGSAFFTPSHPLGSTAAWAQSNSGLTVNDVMGRYTVNGRNPDGSSYRGRVTIENDLGTAVFRWRIAGRSYSGRGNFVDGILTIDWGSSSPVLYKVGDNGILYGTWANGRASEVLTPR